MNAPVRRPPDIGAVVQVLLGLALAALAICLYRLQVVSPTVTWPGQERLLPASGLLLVWLLASGFEIRRHRRRDGLPLDTSGDGFVVAYASQTGFAEQLAAQTATALTAAGRPAQAVSLAALDVATLRERHVLFVVSTTGEGDAPDLAYGFVRQAMQAPATLAGLHYGVLALGDRGYAQFCAFGHRLERWLRLSGAQPLFDLIEVDNGDAAALRHWQHHLRSFIGHAEMADWRAPSYQAWTLVERVCVNPQGVGAPVFRLALRAPDGGATWQAGDIAEIGPRNSDETVAELLMRIGADAEQVLDGEDGPTSLRAALRSRLLPTDDQACVALRGLDAEALLMRLPSLPHREYSIASLPADGLLELLVRQMRGDDGRLGHGSGWLTAHAAIGAPIALRVRSNRNFHFDDRGQPLILIGNGTGIAGLRAHLKARIAAGHHRNWLLFGERSERGDFLFADEIRDWQRNGSLARVDLAFSRDQAERVYVQQRLREQDARLREWLAAGAHVLVCGSLDGMAPAVDAVLRETLRDAAYDVFVESGRYRRDVY